MLTDRRTRRHCTWSEVEGYRAIATVEFWVVKLRLSLNPVRVAATLIAIAALGVFGTKEYRKHVQRQIVDVCWQGSGDSDRVIAACTTSIKSHAWSKDTNASLFYKRSWAHHRKDALDRAIKDIDTAIKLNPDQYWFWVMRGHFHLDKNNTALFEQDLVKALSLTNSEDEQMHVLSERASLNYYRGELSKVEDDYQTILTIDPNHQGAVDGLIELQINLKNYARAIVLLEQAVQRFPDDWAKQVRLGKLHLRYTKDAGKTIAAFTAAKKISYAKNNLSSGTVASTHLFLGIAYLEFGNETMGRNHVEEFATFVNKNPRDGGAANQNLVSAIGNYAMAGNFNLLVRAKVYEYAGRSDLAHAEFVEFEQQLGWLGRYTLPKMLVDLGHMPPKVRKEAFDQRFEAGLLLFLDDVTPLLDRFLALDRR